MDPPSSRPPPPATSTPTPASSLSRLSLSPPMMPKTNSLIQTPTFRVDMKSAAKKLGLGAAGDESSDEDIDELVTPIPPHSRFSGMCITPGRQQRLVHSSAHDSVWPCIRSNGKGSHHFLTRSTGTLLHTHGNCCCDSDLPPSSPRAGRSGAARTRRRWDGNHHLGHL